MKDRIINFLASGFYSGYSPVAPGTAGTAVGVAVAYLLPRGSWHLEIMWIAVVTAASIYLAGEAVRIYGDKDPSRVVCDEISGTLVSFFLIPSTPVNAIMVFILFRIFDIVKPYPAGAIDKRVPGGAGVVLDDVAAGVYANVAAHVLLWLIGTKIPSFS